VISSKRAICHKYIFILTAFAHHCFQHFARVINRLRFAQESGKMGEWGNGEMGKWENGRMGKFENAV
jgi:hypothetical protein